jgi:recombinational DNA repair protein RecT
MATKDEIFNLMKQYTKFDDMFMKAVAADNKTEALDIELQMSKIREQLASLGEVAGATPTTDEQTS